jgi:hypothetical protein
VRAVTGLVVAAVVGVVAVVGAFLGLAVASIYNSNCDSLTEAFVGCQRLEPGPTAAIGAGIGFFVGAIAALLVWAAHGDDGDPVERRRRRRDPD